MSDEKAILYAARYGEAPCDYRIRDAVAVGVMTDQGGIELQPDRQGGVNLRSSYGPLILQPTASNTVRVSVDATWSGCADKAELPDDDPELDRKTAVEALDRLHAITNELCTGSSVKRAADREDIVRRLRLAHGQIGRALR